MDLAVLDGLDARQLREVMPWFLSAYVIGGEAASAARTRAYLTSLDDEALDRLLVALKTVGEEQRVYLANRDGRVLARQWCRDVFTTATVDGAEHLAAAVSAGPTLLLCNHLSYLDAVALDAALAWNGESALADRVVYAAGPKVYADLFRRVAAVCLHTLPVPQSTRLGYTEQLSPRDLARLAIASMDAAHRALDEGLVLLLYPEGSRTRTGRMGPFLKALRRYVDHAGARVVPMVVEGTDAIMPIGDDRLRPGPLSVRFLPPIVVDDHVAKLDVLVATRQAMIPHLPEGQRPEPGEPELF